MTPDPLQVWVPRLEAISRTCADAFRAAVHLLRPELDAQAFERWAARGLMIAQATWRGWEPAVWYFKVSPQLLTRLDLEGLDHVADAALRVMQVSPQLGSELLRGAARFVEQDRQVALRDWSEAGERLASLGRGGRVAEAYFDVSPEVLALISAGVFQEWVGLVTTLARGAESAALEFVRQSSQRLEGVPPLTRLHALRLTQAVARLDPAIAVEVFNALPAALYVVSPVLRERLLTLALCVTGTAHQHLEHLLKAMARLMSGLPEQTQELLLGQCLRVAPIDAEAATILSDQLPRMLGHLAVRDVEAWVSRGLTVLRDNRAGGIAYFAAESQASRTELEALGRIVYLQHEQGVLRLYASALSGRPLGVRPLSELPPAFRSGTRQFPTTDGETIYLPESAERFETRQQNFQVFLVMTAHQAGYLEFGTFGFAFSDFKARLESEGLAVDAERWRPSAPPSGAAPRPDFERFFSLFPRPSLARDLFYILEDGRIDASLRRTYRGLAPHIERLIWDGLCARPVMVALPLWSAVLEMLIHFCGVGHLSTSIPPVLVPLVRFLHGVSGRVVQPHATVYDAAVGAVEVYQLLEQLPNVPLAPLIEAATGEEGVTPGEVLSKDAAADAFRDLLPFMPVGEEVAYQSPEPLPHQGELKPELVQRKLQVQELSDTLEQLAKTAAPMSPERLRELMEQGIDIDIRGTMAQEQDETSGFFVSDLEGKGVAERIEPKRSQPSVDRERLRQQLDEELKLLDGGEVVYRYDEWDYLIRDYRVQWCLLREKPLEGEGEGFVAGILREDAALIGQIRKQFQLLKPEMFKKLKRQDHGEEIDIDAAIEGFVDRRVTGVAPERVYIKRDKREREVSTIFLVDLSASTDDPIEQQVPTPAPSARRQRPPGFRQGALGPVEDDGYHAPPFLTAQQKPQAKRIIDVEREALVVMAEALETIGDEYAIYGFSGYGRDNVEFFIVKDANEPYSPVVKRRIDVMKPYRSTRMGPAIRHAIQKLHRRPARLKTLLVLSDGYPQDFDYGKDRRGKDYGIQDTRVALQEARRKGIHTFCITVDREGKSYLPDMCGADQFIVIENVARLPQLLPKIYRGLTT